MHFVSVRELGAETSEVWRQLAEERDMVVTSNGKPIAILSAVTEDTFEQALREIRRARGMAAVASMQARSVELGNDRMTLEEINAEIEAARREPDR